MFLKYAPKYFEKGYKVIPAIGKVTSVEGWTQKFPDENLLVKNGKGKNIGLCCGSFSGIICLDIDTDDKEVHRICPKSPIGKNGKFGRASFFFRYNGEMSKNIAKTNAGFLVQILSTGKYTILPPSKHPDGHNYYWIDQDESATEDSLLNYELEDLPILDMSFVEELEAYVKKIPYDKTRPITSGRNNKLVEVVTAKFSDGKSINTVAIEALQFDKDNHSPPLFEDPTEKIKGNSPQQRCFNFVTNIFNSLFEKGLIKLQEEIKFEIIKDTPKIEFIEEDLKDVKFPMFRGIAQDIFSIIYDQMVIKRTRFAIASTLACLSTVIGNRYKTFGKYSNLYLLIIGPSGSGKDLPLRFPTELFALFDKSLSGGAPESDTGVLIGLDKIQTRLDVFDEAGKLFGMMADQKNLYASKMADQYATLFTSPGYHFCGKTLKDGRLGECFSPCISILGALTVSDFQETFTSRLISKGLGARFLFFPDMEYKSLNLDSKAKKDIPGHILKWCRKIRRVSEIDAGAKELKTTPDISLFLENTINQLRAKHKDDELLSPVFNRAGEIIVKLALIDELSRNHDATMLCYDSIKWASEWFDAYASSLVKFLPANVKQSCDDFKIQTMILDEIKKAGSKGLTKKELNQGYLIKRKLGLSSRKIEVLISNLIDSDLIYKKVETLKTNCKPTTTYFHENFISFN